MTILTLALLALSAAASTVRMPTRLPHWAGAAVSTTLMAFAAAAGATTGPAHGVTLAATYVVTVLAAVVGGSTIVTAVFRLARRDDGTGPDTAAGPLHGGRTIGVLERAAVAASILAGWPEGIAVVLAVKGLARYPELRGDDNSGNSGNGNSDNDTSGNGNSGNGNSGNGNSDNDNSGNDLVTPAAQVSSASEQFIIGTFTSVIWAVAVCGIGYGVVS